MAARLWRCLHFFLADLSFYSGFLWLWLFLRYAIFRNREVCVLGLHRVLTEEALVRSASLGGIVLKEATFVKLLEYLHQHFCVVSLNTFLGCEGGNHHPSRPWCFLTFDDGWEDNYATAYPWLKKFRLPAAVFVPTSLIDARGGMWVERLTRAWGNSSQQRHLLSILGRVIQDKGQEERLEEIIEYLKHMPAKKRECILDRVLPPEYGQERESQFDRMLSWNQVVEMSRNGIEFGAHTETHPLLTYESDATVERELRMSKHILEERLGKKVRIFAYPDGDWDERIRRWVQATGYECAFTTERGWHRRGRDLYTIRRILLHEGNVTDRKGQFSAAMFNLALAGWSFFRSVPSRTMRQRALSPMSEWRARYRDPMRF